MAFKYAVALTGSIATGKSSAGIYLSKLGFEIIDADSIAHDMLNVQYQAIARLFGEHMLNADKTVNRKALGSVVFSNAVKRKALEDLLHPRIFLEIETQAKQLDIKRTPYLVDIPLFFESKRYPIAKSLLVYTPIPLQLLRLRQRDDSSEEDAQRRIDAQISIEIKKQKADYVIDNSGTLTDLERECKRVKDEILKDFT